jgi:hypothetical protein
MERIFSPAFEEFLLDRYKTTETKQKSWTAFANTLREQLLSVVEGWNDVSDDPSTPIMSSDTLVEAFERLRKQLEVKASRKSGPEQSEFMDDSFQRLMAQAKIIGVQVNDIRQLKIQDCIALLKDREKQLADAERVCSFWFLHAYSSSWLIPVLSI